jgi:hypothetical protein
MEEEDTIIIHYRWLSLKNRAISMAESPGKSPGIVSISTYLLQDRCSPDPPGEAVPSFFVPG